MYIIISMKIVFVSNCFNHHERYLCDELYKHVGVEFYFIQTKPMAEERKKLGWSINLEEFPYCICSYKEEAKCNELINSCDVLIIGSAPFNIYKRRLKEHKPSFYYCESFFKRGFWHILYPKTFFTILKSYIIPSRNQYVNMLCASAFTSLDCARIFSFKNRRYRWGHFIEVDCERDVKLLMDNKKKKREARGFTKILWVGRLLALKHPEMAVKVAHALKNMKIPFEMEIIGTGPLENTIFSQIASSGSSEEVKLLGAMSPTEVRKHMEDADIFMFTSDHNEGWGAVLGEAMSSGCAVVAASAIGATPFLIQDKINGRIYSRTDYKQLKKIVLELVTDPNLLYTLGMRAAQIMQNEWSPMVAADRFCRVAQSILYCKKIPTYSAGPMSKAPAITRNWFD